MLERVENACDCVDPPGKFLRKLLHMRSAWSVVTGTASTRMGPMLRVCLRLLVQCAALFCTYPSAASAVFARVTFARMSDARAVQMNGLGSML